MLEAWLLKMFLWSSSCTATVFGFEGDAYAGGELACVHRHLKRGEAGVAHRDLACGTKVLLFSLRTMRSAVATVVDHGPYGALLRGRWVLKRKSSDPGSWRGCLDISPGAARRLGHNGLEEVRYVVLSQ